MDDEGQPISYRLLEPGAPIHASGGEKLGQVEAVLANEREDIFDGIVIVTPEGRRFVDAPEVGRITDRRVTLTIGADEAAGLPEPEAAAPEFRANPNAGRVGRFFGGGWRRR